MNFEEHKRRKQNRDTAMILIVPVAVLGKIVAFLFLPNKYFYDSMRMSLMLVNSKKMGGWEGYQSTVDIFRKINIFNLTTRDQWSIVMGIVGTLIVIIMISRVKEMSTMEVVYTMMAVGLLNIYAFNIAKEPVQMFFFLCVLIVIVLPFNNSLLKILGCAAVFYWESSTYRSYYILMAAMCVVFYVVFYLFRVTFKRITTLKIIIAAILCLAAMFIFVFASQYVDEQSYNDVVNTKEENKNEGADTAITNIRESDGNYSTFMINYSVNAVRMMIPIELLFKSPGYFPFVIYQGFILMYWIRAIRNIKTINEHGFLALICFTSYIFGSFVFEPDFGSWVRHESASFPVFYILAYQNLCEKKDDDLEESSEIVYETANL